MPLYIAYVLVLITKKIIQAYNSLPVKLSQKKYAKLWAEGFGLKM